MDKYHEALRLGKRGELFVFTQLLQRGVIPYAPLLDIEAVDCIVRKAGGGFLEIQVKTNNTPDDPLWWVTSAVPKTDNYVLVFVSVPRNWDVWIFTGKDFYKHCTGEGNASGTLNLDLGAKGREAKVEYHKNNWEIILSKAGKNPVENVSMEDLRKVASE